MEKKTSPQACVLDCAARVVRGINSFAGRLPGQYTVSKLDGFERFRQETSGWKMAGILFLTPLPFLVFNLLLECIPLEPTANGFWSSGCYQLRTFLTAICSSIAPALLKLNCVPGFPLNSVRALTVYGLFQGAVGIAFNAIISLAAKVFPVPFSQFTMIIPLVISGRLIFFRQLPDDPQFHALSDKVNQWLGMETLPILVYPVFTALFMVLTSTQQMWLSVLLPVIKLSVRYALWLVARDDYDLVGVITCCVGHLYHILFTAMILQNSKSLETLAVVVLFNTGQMVVNYRYILADSYSITQARANAEGLGTEDHVRVALESAQELRIAQNLHWRRPSLFMSTYPGYQGAAFMETHKEVLGAASRYNAANRVTRKTQIAAHGTLQTPDAVRNAPISKPIDSERKISLAFSSIMPWNDGVKLKHHVTDRVLRLSSRGSIEINPTTNSMPLAWERGNEKLVTREAVVHEVAKSLHQTEIILLRSYITICMTLFYVIYLLIVFRLTNRQYFATLVYLTTREAVDAAVQRLLLLCAVEIVFLSIYLVLIRKRLGIWGLDQLAFVLYSQLIPVQAKFYVTIVILGFPLTHNGNDSILRFDNYK